MTFKVLDLFSGIGGFSLGLERTGGFTTIAFCEIDKFCRKVRAVRMVRPKFAVLENVAALLDRGVDAVLGSLASIGYDAEWDCVPAAAVGAPQLRDRVFIVAYPDSAGRERLEERNIFAQAGFKAPRRRHVDGLDLVEAGPWSSLPDVLRVDYGLPGVVDRLRSTGNAIVPGIPEMIGNDILKETAQEAR